jgi:magnesium transporter
MLTTYYDRAGQLEIGTEGNLNDAAWIDLYAPSTEEEQRVEAELKITIPTREEMREVESSSALYHEGDATYITVRAVERGSRGEPGLTSFTLVLVRQQFITLRYAEPKSFVQFLARTHKPEQAFPSSQSLLLCLLETMVDRDADILEEIGDALDPISLEIFSRDTSTSMENIAAKDLSQVLTRIGNAGELAARVRQSLHSIGRALPFLKLEVESNTALDTRLKTLTVDVQSLLEHDNFLQTQIQFLLDSNIGLISIQQNAIMKTLSVAAVIFLPPTLIGSIYGMNFEHMPELHWAHGYAFALGLMLLSVVLPLAFFRIRRWF